MKWRPIIFLFFLIPYLAYGFSKKEAKQIRAQAFSEWNRHSELYDDYKNFGADVEGRGLHRLKESLHCCQRALSLTDKNLNKIASLSKKNEKKRDGVALKRLVNKIAKTSYKKLLL